MRTSQARVGHSERGTGTHSGLTPHRRPLPPVETGRAQHVGMETDRPGLERAASRNERYRADDAPPKDTQLDSASRPGPHPAFEDAGAVGPEDGTADSCASSSATIAARPAYSRATLVYVARVAAGVGLPPRGHVDVEDWR